MHWMCSATPPAQETDDGADPAAGADLVPEAGPATANPGPDHTPDPSPALPGTRRPRPSPNLVLDPDPDPDPGPGPEVAPRPLKGGLGRDLKASPSPQQKMEVNPHKTQHKRKRWAFHSGWKVLFVLFPVSLIIFTCCVNAFPGWTVHTWCGHTEKFVFVFCFFK